MKQTATPQAPRADDPRRSLSTEELAARLGIKPQTLRAALCRNGEYYGVRPTVFCTGRLMLSRGCLPGSLPDDRDSQT